MAYLFRYCWKTAFRTKPRPFRRTTFWPGLSEFVYISVDLDVLDPGIMAAVGTPEPGGVTWRQLTSLLRRVGESRRIVGFDVCELAPNQGPPACSYTAAKLVYKLAQYACCLPRPACQAGTVTG